MYKKSYQHSGKMTSAIYQAVKVQTEVAKFEHHRSSVSGVLSKLGVSRSGYFA
jgi:hypothetical protein